MRRLKVYIAATRKEDALRAIEKMKGERIEVVSTWHDTTDTTDDVLLRRQGQQAWHQITSCDTLLLLNLDVSEAKATETGIALQASIPVVGLGRPSQLFHYLPGIIWCETVGKAIEALPALS